VAARSKAQVYGRSPAEIVGSNPTGEHAVYGAGLRPLACGFESHRGAWMFVVGVVCCQRSLRRADHSSRGVLPTVVRRVRSTNIVYEEALAPWGGGAVAPKK